MRKRTFDRQRRILLAATCAAVAAAGLSRPGRGDEPVSGPGGAAARPPNILLIFVDDLGYADVGAFGCRDIPTPNIDSLAREGVRFTNAYCTAAWCVPSRAGLLTGFFASRPAPRGAGRIGSQLAAAGYATMEMGKLWHGRAECSEYLVIGEGRYLPPNPVERTGGSLLPRGNGGPERIRYSLPRHKRGQWVGPGRKRKATNPGRHGVVDLSPCEFLDRLADLVPPPRRHRHRYHGVFAPNHPLRPAVTALAIANASSLPLPPGGGRGEGAPDAPGRSHDTSRIAWAKLVARKSRSLPARVPRLRRRHPPHRLHHRPGADQEDPAPSR